MSRPGRLRSQSIAASPCSLKQLGILYARKTARQACSNSRRLFLHAIRHARHSADGSLACGVESCYLLLASSICEVLFRADALCFAAAGLARLRLLRRAGPASHAGPL